MSKMPVLFIGHGSPMNAMETRCNTEYIRSHQFRGLRSGV